MNSTLTPSECRRHVRLMGSAFEFIAVDEQGGGERYIDLAIDEVKRIEALLTEFSPDSETSRINHMAWREPITVDGEVYDILQRCKVLSTLTQGAFDITSGVLKKLYNFRGESFAFPHHRQLRQALQKVGSDKIRLMDEHRVSLEQQGMHIAFGAIGKGYAADRVKKLLTHRGLSAGVVNASGDLTVWGFQPDGTPWTVGIADPQHPSQIIGVIPVTNASIATSGNYEQYFERHGTRYAHNIDPKTGLPVKGIRSVTIVSSSAELSDALATAVTIMGVDAGLHFIEQLPNTHALVIDDQNRIFTTSHLEFVQP